MKFFNELIETIMNKSRAGFGLSNRTSVSVSNNPKEMITSVMTAVGELSSIAYADQFLRLFDEMDLSKKQELFIKSEYHNLRNFLTLSPLPYFSTWLEKVEPHTFSNFALIDWSEASEQNEKKLIEAAGRYFLDSTRKDKQPNDPVARFHLGNGALLDRINPSGNLSNKGLSESFGMMVNYRYDLPNVEKNHEAYAKEQKIAISQEVKKLFNTP